MDRTARRSGARRSPRRETIASTFVAILAALGVPRIAQAASEPLPLELTWDAPEGCPDASFVTARVEQILLGSRVAPMKVTGRGKIEKNKDARFDLALSIRTGDVEETRHLVADTCPALAHAGAVLVALAIDPSHDERQVEAEPPAPQPPADEARPAAPPTPTPRPAPESTLRPPPLEPPEAVPRMRFAVGAGGALVSGVLPDASGGIGLSATLRLGRFRAGILGTYWVRQSPTFQGGAGASFDMLEGGAFGAYLFRLGPVMLGPSLGVEACHVQVQGFGIRAPRATSTLWPTAVLGGRLEARLSSWIGLFARMEAISPIDAPTFTLTTVGNAVQLHDPAPIAPRAGLGAEIVLP